MFGSIPTTTAPTCKSEPISSLRALISMKITQIDNGQGVTLHSYHVQKRSSASGLLFYSHLPANIECFSEDNLSDNLVILIPLSVSCLKHALTLRKCSLINSMVT